MRNLVCTCGHHLRDHNAVDPGECWELVSSELYCNCRAFDAASDFDFVDYESKPESVKWARDALAIRRVRAICDEAEEDSAPAYPPSWVSDVREALGGTQ